MALITENCGVILKKGANLKYIYVKPGNPVNMERMKIKCGLLIGHPYGTGFKVVNNNQLEVVDPITVEETYEEYVRDSVVEVKEDNRHINDDKEESRQTLSKDEIESFKESGKTGEEIIEQIIENSSTFNQRTEFSKAKYTKKKKQKYLSHFVALKPTIALLAQMYSNKKSDKILHLQPDLLAHMLSWANVQASSNALLVDDTGLVTAAMMNRIIPEGTITLFTNSFMNHGHGIVKQLGISNDQIQKHLLALPLKRLEDLRMLMEQKTDIEAAKELLPPSWFEEVNGTSEDMANNIETEPADSEIKRETDTEDSKTEVGQKRTLREKDFSETCKKAKIENGTIDPLKQVYRDAKVSETVSAIGKMRNGNFSCLVMASKFHPKRLLSSLFPYLGVSRPFAIYCQQREPLMECYMMLKDMGVCCMEVGSHWTRDIQVMPGRTHPKILMPSAQGFVLKGIKVEG